MSPPSRTPHAALVMAHPGHELRIHGWLERTRPLTFVLTDGSGHTSSSRLASTTRVLTAAGAQPAGVLYGQLTDREVYQALRAFDADLFLDYARVLAHQFVTHGITVVVGDAREGYNPMHDVCRMMTDAAVALAGRVLHRPISSYQFATVGDPVARPAGATGEPLTLRLDSPELTRKLVASHGYTELAEDVHRALAVTGDAAFGVECLWPIRASVVEPLTDVPEYEAWGEARVSAGHYGQVIRYLEHVRPLEDRLRRLVNEAEP